MEQLTKFELINNQNLAIKEGRDFIHVLERVGKEPFFKKDLEFYFRTLGEIKDRIESNQSLIKTFISSIGQYTKPETKRAIGEEAKERLESSMVEIVLLLKEISIGKEAEFTQLTKEFRRRLKG